MTKVPRRREATYAYDPGRFVIHDLDELDNEVNKILKPAGLTLTWDADGKYSIGCREELRNEQQNNAQ